MLKWKGRRGGKKKKKENETGRKREMGTEFLCSFLHAVYL